MALARIISHSHQHCRELAMDLLARGYTVEIISPDKIPDNFADLELRVDADSTSDLTARVAARTGEHSSILDFVHHLSAPMGDFVRRPPKAKFESIAHATPVNFNAEPAITAEVAAPPVVPALESPKLAAPPDVELPIPPPSPAIATPAISLLPEAEQEPPLISGGEEVFAEKRRQRPKRGITIIVHRSRPKLPSKLKTAKRAGGWFLRVAAGFALVVALSAIPIIGIRGGGPLLPSAAADSPKLALAETDSRQMPELPPPAAAAAVLKNSTPDPPERKQELPSSSLPATDRLSSELAKGESSLGKINDLAPEGAIADHDKPARTDSRAHHKKVKHQHSDDTVAQDTVTYLDRGSSPKNH